MVSAPRGEQELGCVLRLLQSTEQGENSFHLWYWISVLEERLVHTGHENIGPDCGFQLTFAILFPQMARQQRASERARLSPKSYRTCLELRNAMERCFPSVGEQWSCEHQNGDAIKT